MNIIKKNYIEHYKQLSINSIIFLTYPKGYHKPYEVM
jgi:hypothetical protein